MQSSLPYPRGIPLDAILFEAWSDSKYEHIFQLRFNLSLPFMYTQYLDTLCYGLKSKREPNPKRIAYWVGEPLDLNNILCWHGSPCGTCNIVIPI